MLSNVSNFSLRKTMQYKSLILLAIITSNGLCTINTYEMDGEMLCVCAYNTLSISVQRKTYPDYLFGYSLEMHKHECIWK